MVLYVHGNPIRIIRDGRREVSGEEGDYKKYTFRYTQCHHQNDSCIKIGSDESHFKVSLTVRDNFFNEKKM